MRALHAQVLYVFTRESRPVFVPLVRYDGYEMNDGIEEDNRVTLQLVAAF